MSAEKEKRKETCVQGAFETNHDLTYESNQYFMIKGRISRHTLEFGATDLNFTNFDAGNDDDRN